MRDEDKLRGLEVTAIIFEEAAPVSDAALTKLRSRVPIINPDYREPYSPSPEEIKALKLLSWDELAEFILGSNQKRYEKQILPKRLAFLFNYSPA